MDKDYRRFYKGAGNTRLRSLDEMTSKEHKELEDFNISQMRVKQNRITTLALLIKWHVDKNFDVFGLIKK